MRQVSKWTVFPAVREHVGCGPALAVAAGFPVVVPSRDLSSWQERSASLPSIFRTNLPICQPLLLRLILERFFVFD